jgi:hypothetical protein
MSEISQVSGRGESRPLSPKWRVSSLAALTTAVLVGIVIFMFGNLEMWTPLHHWYRSEYLTTKMFLMTRGDYQLLEEVDAHGKQFMALDADVVTGSMQGPPPSPFALMPKARQAGVVALKVDTVRTSSAAGSHQVNIPVIPMSQCTNRSRRSAASRCKNRPARGL